MTEAVGGRRGVVTDDARTSSRALWDAAALDFAAYRAGNASALDDLVHRLTPVLWQIVRAYRLDVPTAEDVVQSTWLTLVRRADSIEDPQAVGRWLTVTARREAWRAARMSGRVESVGDDDLDLRESALEAPEAAALRTARDGALWESVNLLSERCQRLLRVVAFVERPSYADIAADLHMPVGSIGPTRARCLAKLRELLATAEWQPA